MTLSPRAALPAVVALAACTVPPTSAAEWALESTPLDRSAAELERTTDAHVEAAEALRDEIVGLEGERTVENTLEPYNRLEMHLDAAASDCQLMFNVHPNEAVRDVAQDGEQRVSRLRTRLSLSRELYDALAAIDRASLDEETGHALKKILLDFRRSGVDREEAVREQVAALREDLTELGQRFSENIASGQRSVTFDSVDALAGLPEDWIAQHAPDARGRVTVDTTYPDYIPFMTYAEDGEAREALYRAYLDRAHPENLEVLEELVRTRHELATLLGYEHWADYITEDKMIGSAAAAQEFIDRVARLSRRAAMRDYALLLDRKRRDTPSATSVADYEKGYYGELVRNEQFELDSQEVRAYFDFEAVRQGLFDVTGRLFGVRYEPVEGLDLWHEDVTAWDLLEGDERIGRFYLDLHPREDKYNHAACFPYRGGIDGQRLPQAVLVCNFPNPRTSDDGHALMEFGEVNTFFHEFGHLLHVLFGGHRRWMNTSGISTEWDFVEAPSQMLEEWVYDLETLQLFARHVETGEPIPAALVEKLRRARDFGKGTNAAHQMFYAALSLNLYDRHPAGLDTTALVREMQRRYSPFEHVEGTHMQCSFGHLDGYSAIYYTYMWSKVIAKDMFSRFEAEGLLDPQTARAYRAEILEMGGARPAAELVEAFLGRPYSFEAFERYLDRDASSDA